MANRADYEDRFCVALKRIAAYMTPERLRRQADKAYGLSYEEALEMAYDNIQGEALSALKGYRRKRKPVHEPGHGSVVYRVTGGE